MKVRRIGYALGAVVAGVDLRAADQRTIAAIREAALEHVLLVFPAQPLEPAPFRAFCSGFGPLEDNSRFPVRRHPDDPALVVLANRPVRVSTRAIGAGGIAGVANRWHSDLSFTDHPSTFTFLNAKQLPTIGGNTLFANGYLAFEALSPACRRMIEELHGVQDVRLLGPYGRSTPELQAQLLQLNPPIAHPLARRHPETGRTALYAGDYIARFDGWTEAESAPLLRFLNAHAGRHEFCYRHTWSTDDLVMWDNRAAMHFAVPDYDLSELRSMLRASVRGPKCGREVIAPN